MIRNLTAAAVAIWLATGLRADDKGFTDADFVKKAAGSGIKEVALGKLGTAMAKTDGVKKFSEMVVMDHAKANEELKAAGVAVPDSPMPDDQKAHRHVQGPQGGRLRQALVEHMVQSHEKGVALFTTANKEAKDPNLKAFAAKTLPTLQQHLDMAKKLHAGGK
jgi:putative membrane protein